MSKNSIKFSENGTEFHFIFSDGSESLSFDSQFSGIHAVADLFTKGKISKNESKEMLHNIVNEKKLPFKSGIEMTLLGISLLIPLMDNILDKINESIHFHVCEKCKKHGRIIGDGIVVGDFYSKKEAKTCLEDLFNKGKIGMKENAIINYEIEKSELSN